MENREVLHIGVGRCGNAIVDGLSRANSSFIGMLYNTAANDLNELESYIDGIGTVLIPNADGTGKDRDLAKEYAIARKDMFEDKLSASFSMCKYFVFYFSMDGGTGSGCSPALIEILHDYYNGECEISIVATIRSKHASKVQLENTKACWNDLKELQSRGIIKSLMFIDNDARESEEEINGEVIRTLAYSYSLKDLDDSGAIDTTDMGRYFNATGYRTAYVLNNKYGNFSEALKNAIDESVFLKPEKYEITEEIIDSIKNNELLSEKEKEIKIEEESKFSYRVKQLIGLIQTTRYKISDVLGTINAVDNNKIGVNDNNVIAISGMDIPPYKFNEVNSRLKMASIDLNIQKKEVSFYDEVITKEEPSPVSKGRRNTGRKRKSIDDILNKNAWRKSK